MCLYRYKQKNISVANLCVCTHTHLSVYICVCVDIYVCVRERERERGWSLIVFHADHFKKCVLIVRYVIVERYECEDNAAEMYISV